MVRLLLILFLFSTSVHAQFNRQHLLKPKQAAVTGASENIFGTTLPGGSPAADGQEINLGIKISPTVNGVISAIRWYKPSGMNATLTVTLYSFNAGVYTVLQSGTRANDAVNGWVEVPLSSSVSVTAGNYYLAQVHTPNYYYATTGYFTTNIFSAGGHIYAPQSNEADATALGGYNGVYSYSTSATTAATLTFNKGNYWVDVVFTPN